MFMIIGTIFVQIFIWNASIKYNEANYHNGLHWLSIDSDCMVFYILMYCTQYVPYVKNMLGPHILPQNNKNTLLKTIPD